MAANYGRIHDHVKQAERYLDFVIDEINYLNQEAVPINEVTLTRNDEIAASLIMAIKNISVMNESLLSAFIHILSNLNKEEEN